MKALLHILSIASIISLLTCNGQGCKGNEAGTAKNIANVTSEDIEELSSSYDEGTSSSDIIDSFEQGEDQPDFNTSRPDIPKFNPYLQCFPYVTPDACNIPLPEPDTPCENEGQIRCTNVGLRAYLAVKHSAVCLRPNYVRCERASDGELIWRLYPVDQTGYVPVEDYPLSGQGIFCQENERGVAFCPSVIRADTEIYYPPISSPLFLLCDTFARGQRHCRGYTAVHACLFGDEVKDPIAKKHFVEPLIAKYPHIANCLYYWFDEICPFVGTCFWDGDMPIGRQVGRCVWKEDCTVKCAEWEGEFCHEETEPMW